MQVKTTTLQNASSELKSNIQIVTWPLPKIRTITFQKYAIFQINTLITETFHFDKYFLSLKISTELQKVNLQ